MEDDSEAVDATSTSDSQEANQQEADVTTSNASQHHTYSIYEPHFQQMHPLIYYEEPNANFAPNNSHHHPHTAHQIIAPGMHNWDAIQDHYQVHMPMMIPYGDTSKRSSETTGEQQPLPVNEIILTTPSPTNRELHNEIERRRRSRIKNCCEVLRGKIPGLNDKTDKATVLEHTVKFINHIFSCPEFKCDCEIWQWAGE